RQRGGDDLVGLRVVATGADVEVLVVEAQVDLGRLGRRLALFRLELAEAVEVRRRLPDRIVQPAVDHLRGGEVDRAGDIGAFRRGGGRQDRAGGRRRHLAGGGRDERLLGRGR